jgi:tetratricopeptide (TPR) repeat protein
MIFLASLRVFRVLCGETLFCAFLLCGCAMQKASAPPPGGPLEKKLSENPDDRSVNLKLGEQSEATGDLLRAEQYYLRAEALGEPEDGMLPRLLRVLVKAQRYDEALARCRRRLESKPTDRATRYVEAALFVALDRAKEAEKELETLQRTQPDDADAYLALGRLYRDIGDARARPMFEKYLALAPNGESAAQVRFDLQTPAETP